MPVSLFLSEEGLLMSSVDTFHDPGLQVDDPDPHRHKHFLFVSFKKREIGSFENPGNKRSCVFKYGVRRCVFLATVSFPPFSIAVVVLFLAI